MSSDATAKTLSELGVGDADAVARHFAEVQERFESESSGVAQTDVAWRELRDAWLGRKSGVLTRITENWLKPSPPELKRAVGQELNKLRAHVEGKLAELERAIQAAAESAAT